MTRDRAPRTKTKPSVWKKLVANYQQPKLRSSLWQLTNSLLPYLALWGLMIWTFHKSYLLTLVLALIASGFLLRIFIIFHDCGHGSFFQSRRANRITEFLTGVLTFTPYRQWTHDHALHHATAGDLDRRGTGDIWTMTVREYIEASRWKRFIYRLVRNPIVLFGLAPWFVYLVQQRFPSSNSGRRERRGVLYTNVALLAVVTLMTLTIGLKAYLMIQLPIVIFSSAAGVWLFYVQHQFEGVEWDRREDWDYTEAALRGSSFYKLPGVLQWFSGNIGFHHIHHLSPSIPNYLLEKCHKENPLFHEAAEITLWSSMKSFTYRLWDEKKRKLVGYRRMRAIRREIRAGSGG